MCGGGGGAGGLLTHASSFFISLALGNMSARISITNTVINYREV